MQLSYAQNMEDMHLARIFAGQTEVFYIDVGGGHPVADNVSFAAYLAGGCGLVIEPQAELYRLYNTLRPRDIVRDVLVGRTSGDVSFHVVDKLHGFSTTVEAHAVGAAGFGASYTTVTKPMMTLAALCELHAPARIDWLKIDVEGAEADVLAGNDWLRFRPRVVLIEAISPGTMEPSHGEWEPLLLAANYTFAFFDGLNRWYVAVEASDLIQRFPPAYLDWGSVRHLYDHGPARENAEHPDHTLASALMGLDPASLPLVDPAIIFGFLTKNLTADDLQGPAASETLERFAHLWLGTEPHRFDPESHVGRPLELALQELATTDAFRAALGRIAAAYDGGFIIDG